VAAHHLQQKQPHRRLKEVLLTSRKVSTTPSFQINIGYIRRLAALPSQVELATAPKTDSGGACPANRYVLGTIVVAMSLGV
jgi:hypothetical protein